MGMALADKSNVKKHLLSCAQNILQYSVSVPCLQQKLKGKKMLFEARPRIFLDYLEIN